MKQQWPGKGFTRADRTVLTVTEYCVHKIVGRIKTEKEHQFGPNPQRVYLSLVFMTIE